MDRDDDRYNNLVQVLFIAAIRDGQRHTVHALLSQGADPRSDFALVEAATFGHHEIVSLLLEAGANVHAQNDSAICAAATRGHVDAVRGLLDAGADFSVHNHAPLRRAEAGGHTDVARLLRQAGSYNPDIPSDDPATQRRDALLKKLQP